MNTENELALGQVDLSLMADSTYYSSRDSMKVDLDLAYEDRINAANLLVEHIEIYHKAIDEINNNPLYAEAYDVCSNMSLSDKEAAWAACDKEMLDLVNREDLVKIRAESIAINNKPKASTQAVSSSQNGSSLKAPLYAAGITILALASVAIASV